jgi:hypothetical protein
MGITVRGDGEGDWVVTHRVSGLTHAGLGMVKWSTTIRTYTCTNWTDAMRIADDLANERTIDPNRIIALSERRV